MLLTLWCLRLRRPSWLGRHQFLGSVIAVVPPSHRLNGRFMFFSMLQLGRRWQRLKACPVDKEFSTRVTTATQTSCCDQLHCPPEHMKKNLTFTIILKIRRVQLLRAAAGRVWQH